MSAMIGIKIPGANLEGGVRQTADVLDLLVETGYQAFEFTPESFDLIECGKVCQSRLRELTILLDDYALRPVLHVPLRLNLFNRDALEIHRHVLSASCQVAEAVGAKLVVYHPGRAVDNVEFSRMGKPSPQMTFSAELMAIERDVLQTIADEHSGLTIAMENHRPYLDYSPYSYAEYCSSLANQIADIDRSNVRGTIDTGHLNLCAAYHKLDITEEMRALRPHIVHCHLHDNHGITNYYTDKDKAGMLPFGIGDEHIVPGTGTFPFDQFFSVMDGYSGIYMIELTGRIFFPKAVKHAYQQVVALRDEAREVKPDTYDD
jgi:sugar phosphate isomerase/epimerase